MSLSRSVLDTIQRHALLRRNARVLVALSGGSDSVALLLLLRELEREGEVTVAGVAHLNHGLRPDAGKDEQFCRALADEIGVPFRSEIIDVRARAEVSRTSIEVAGRQARYEFFQRVADELQADAIATGHTKDDLAETFLLRLLRGAGPRGLAGIHPRVGSVVRPLLEIGRDELRAYLVSRDQPFCEDATNADVSIPRNRVRHELLPLLRERFSPSIKDVLAREASIARQDEDRLEHEAIDLASLIVLRGETRDTVELDRPALVALHPAIAVRVARLALHQVAPNRFVGFDHIERLLEFARQPDERGTLSLPGQDVIRRGRTLLLSKAPFKPFSNSFQVLLSIPGEVTFGHWAVSATRCRQAEQFGPGVWPRSWEGVSPLEAVLDAEKVSPVLTVRTRRPGDRLKPLGMGGREKKLQDLLVDRKIERERRDSLPLVVDEMDRILWVVGEAVSEDFRVTEPSQAVIFLKARRLGGQG
jgi:tRNA(Ile)-lysidine synthase